jgi:hypothetical protein
MSSFIGGAALAVTSDAPRVSQCAEIIRIIGRGGVRPMRSHCAVQTFGSIALNGVP